ncbi:NADP-dependent oxidoreductase [Achromobacter aloeverae]|uniref:NADP-dependent oxidoreductase n=1 Tax=Achromobacter aloeverae TaxID=1750518 RepID=A0A4Q1HKI8_9BURK|nr:NADP-dependent oxidoreductase [Achromobacter aloeverae]RXN90551.1 NADP-dependent oxidoreductase [Achromobacter aloeverae]
MAATPVQARRIVLAARPQGEPKETDFRSETFTLGEPEPGQVLLESLYLSLDPYMRGRMSDAKSYAPSVALGQTIVGEVVARVLASAAPGYAVGDLVLAHAGWTTHALMDAKGLVKIDPATAPLETRLGVLGMPGFTAYAGLREIGRPRAGETVVVAAASGPVGSLVGQLAKRDGARAVGIAGGADKCAYVKKELGFDAVIDHRRDDMAQALAAACPDGIDVYFENVGGAVWEAVFPLLNAFARVPVCGLIADYNGTSAPSGDLTVPGLMRGVLTKRLTLRGFINYDLEFYREDFLREVGAGLRDGTIRHTEDISVGLDSAPQAFMGMLKGRNFGKVLVRLAQ